MRYMSTLDEYMLQPFNEKSFIVVAVVLYDLKRIHQIYVLISASEMMVINNTSTEVE